MITKEFLEGCIPAFKNGNDEIYELLIPFLTETETKLNKFTGNCEIDESIKNRYICIHTALRAIPHLDITLTPTGFGVVHNESITPASKERVQALMTSLSVDECLAFEEIITALQKTLWADTTCAKSYFDTLFPFSSDLMKYGLISSPTANNISLLKPSIQAKELEIKKIIGKQVFESLYLQLRKNRWGHPKYHSLCRYLRIIISTQLYDVMSLTEKNSLVSFLMENEINEFINSPEYELLKKYIYKNKKDDPCFFF